MVVEQTFARGAYFSGVKAKLERPSTFERSL
jgi:hypothetical protein